MAAPTTEFNNADITLAGTALDTNAERLAIDDLVSTGGGNEWDFGNVNISGGQADSAVLALLWQVSAFGANVQVENFRFWLDSNGFDIAGSVLKYVTWKLDATTEWETSPSTPLTGEVTLPETEPSQNVYQGGDGTTASIPSGDNDTSQAIAVYCYVESGETTGVYKGLDAGFELRFNYKYDYY